MKWTPTKRRESQTFISENNEDQGISLTITNTGFEDLYTVFQEDTAIGVIFHNKAFTKAEIKEQFNIEVSF